MKAVEKVVLVVIVLSIVFASTVMAIPVFAGETDFVAKFENKKGTITFNHSTHNTKIECESCHKVVKPVSKLTGHSFCKDCHKYQNGPTTCKGCHTN